MKNENSTFKQAFGYTVDIVFVIVILGLTYVAYAFELEGIEYTLGEAFQGKHFAGVAILVIFGILLNIGKLLLVINNSKLAFIMRMVLVAYTLSMTMLVASKHIVNPNVEAAYFNAKQLNSQQKEQALLSITYQFDEKLTLNKQLFENERKIEADVFQPQDDELTKNLDIQRGIGGQHFKGEKYNDFDARQKELRADHRTTMNNIRERETQAITTILADKGSAIDKVNKQYAFDLTVADFKGSDAAQNQTIVRVIAIIKTVYDAKWLNPQVIGLMLIVLVTVIVEFLPLVLLSSCLKKWRARAPKNVVQEVHTSDLEATAKPQKQSHKAAWGRWQQGNRHAHIFAKQSFVH